VVGEEQYRIYAVKPKDTTSTATADTIVILKIAAPTDATVKILITIAAALTVANLVIISPDTSWFSPH